MKEGFKKYFKNEEILEMKVGIERECLRITREGFLSKEKHPESFGNKLTNPYITTDFSESQLEFITPALKSSKENYDFLENLYNIAALNSKEDEIIWPQSMPCTLPEEIPIAIYDNSTRGKEAREYREYLIKKYGKDKQLITGIHYNFSYSDDFIKKVYKIQNSKKDFRGFKDEFYLKLSRQYLRYGWLIIYLLGATPKTLDNSGLKYESKAISLRNSKLGYRNKEELLINYNSVAEYVSSINKYIDDKILIAPKELYSQVRLKTYNEEDPLKSLLKGGIKYLEYRAIDINPLDKAGIAYNDIEFLKIFNLFLIMEEESSYDNWQVEAIKNSDKVCTYGLTDITLLKNGLKVNKKDWALQVIEKIECLNSELSLHKDNIIEEIKARILDEKLTYAFKVLEGIKKEGDIKFFLNLANKYKKGAYEDRFVLKGYENMELSTQILIKESIKRGIAVSVLDKDDNFISLKKDDNIQLVKQATKTSKDNYISVLAMENKVVTKNILKEHKIKVPDGIELSNIEDAKKNIDKILNKSIVIKPKSTNFGVGISIFDKGANERDIIKAFEIAFKYDKTILVEEFIKGKEYRFLVIDEKVCGILHREPANVIGDGIKTITELVKEKNKNPLRGKGYKKPLEQINLDENARLFLKQISLDFDFIPKLGQKIYLRENSNISTGGDSIDYTNLIHNKFKEKAIECVKAIDAKICGVDMMIEDYSNENSPYGVIELNFNPAIHIHSFPGVGVERNIAIDILKLLKLA